MRKKTPTRTNLELVVLWAVVVWTQAAAVRISRSASWY